MLLKIKTLKFTNWIKFVFVFLISSYAVQAQEVLVPDEPGVVKAKDSLQHAEVIDTDSVRPFPRFKAEGISAVVGEYVILDTDIDKAYLEMRSQGISIEGISRCELLGKLMEDKLYAHQAKQDSLVVSDVEINS